MISNEEKKTIFFYFDCKHIPIVSFLFRSSVFMVWFLSSVCLKRRKMIDETTFLRKHPCTNYSCFWFFLGLNKNLAFWFCFYLVDFRVLILIFLNDFSYSYFITIINTNTSYVALLMHINLEYISFEQLSLFRFIWGKGFKFTQNNFLFSVFFINCLFGFTLMWIWRRIAFDVLQKKQKPSEVELPKSAEFRAVYPQISISSKHIHKKNRINTFFDNSINGLLEFY